MSSLKKMDTEHETSFLKTNVYVGICRLMGRKEPGYLQGKGFRVHFFLKFCFIQFLISFQERVLKVLTIIRIF